MAWWCCTVPLMAPTAFGDVAIRDWVPALQHISGRGGMGWVLVDLILCSRVVLAGGWCPSVVLGDGGGETCDSGVPGISLSKPQLPVCKNWGPFPQNYYPERTGDTAMHPQVSGTSMLSVGHPCWICSYPSLFSRPVSIQGRVDLGFGSSTWWMLKTLPCG